jgi:hypothetical protein
MAALEPALERLVELSPDLIETLSRLQRLVELGTDGPSLPDARAESPGRGAGSAPVGTRVGRTVAAVNYGGRDACPLLDPRPDLPTPVRAPWGRTWRKHWCPGDGARGTRTPDLLGAIQALSQLSYSPGNGCRGRISARDGQRSVARATRP